MNSGRHRPRRRYSRVADSASKWNARNGREGVCRSRSSRDGDFTRVWSGTGCFRPEDGRRGCAPGRNVSGLFCFSNHSPRDIIGGVMYMRTGLPTYQIAGLPFRPGDIFGRTNPRVNYRAPRPDCLRWHHCPCARNRVTYSAQAGCKRFSTLARGFASSIRLDPWRKPSSDSHARTCSWGCLGGIWIVTGPPISLRGCLRIRGDLNRTAMNWIDYYSKKWANESILKIQSAGLNVNGARQRGVFLAGALRVVARGLPWPVTL